MPDTKKIKRILSVLDNKVRLRILLELKEKIKMTFSEIYKNTFNEKVSKFELDIHLRLLYVSDLIKNDGFSDNAEFRITQYGSNVVNALEANHDIAKAICSK